jgi:ABC-type Fe3+/spermidine/putrescine transport system ATPase subunit
MAISDRIAVMKKGRVLQVGAPQELYLNPQNIFVAHFIGESNFLEGYISNEGDKEAAIELRGGIKIQSASRNLAKTGKVVLAIRPEAFDMEKGAKKVKNSIFGVIEKVTFEGTNMRYEVRLENQDLVVIVKPSLIGEWFNINEKVTLSFPPEKVHVFAYPETGLREEIAVE